MLQNSRVSTTKRLIESAIMVSIGTVLSLIKLIDMPYGGSVTVGCMLPVIIIAYRHGFKWGLITGFVFGLLQQLLGLDNLSYVTTWQSIVAVILLDYIVAYMAVGFAGIFRKTHSQKTALLSGSVIACILRYLCHVISGATVWAGLAIPTKVALIYSLGYNATYMIPEMIVTAILAYYIGSVLDFSNENIIHLEKSRNTELPLLKWIGGLVLAGAFLFDIRSVFANTQNAETGDFDLSGLTNVNYTLILLITVISVIIACVMFYASGRKHKEA